jgi:hypothetical protein
MTRRELTQAVFRAARIYEAARSGPQFFIGSKGEAVAASIRALDACTEPDLAALDAAVAQAVEMHDEKLLRAGGMSPRLRQAALDYRAALKPRARYEDLGACIPIIRDRQKCINLTPHEVAALLNEKEAAK